MSLRTLTRTALHDRAFRAPLAVTAGLLALALAMLLAAALVG